MLRSLEDIHVLVGLDGDVTTAAAKVKKSLDKAFYAQVTSSIFKSVSENACQQLTKE